MQLFSEKELGSGLTTLIISNKEMNDIRKISNHLKNLVVTETIKNEENKQKV